MGRHETGRAARFDSSSIRTHTRSILWVIAHTHARIQNAGFYPTRCGYFLLIPTGYG
jgi:hypothetical protein